MLLRRLTTEYLSKVSTTQSVSQATVSADVLIHIIPLVTTVTYQ